MLCVRPSTAVRTKLKSLPRRSHKSGRRTARPGGQKSHIKREEQSQYGEIKGRNIRQPFEMRLICDRWVLMELKRQLQTETTQRVGVSGVERGLLKEMSAGPRQLVWKGLLGSLYRRAGEGTQSHKGFRC